MEEFAVELIDLRLAGPEGLPVGVMYAVKRIAWPAEAWCNLAAELLVPGCRPLGPSSHFHQIQISLSFWKNPSQQYFEIFSQHSQ
jgi:hypothetical protein